MPDTEFVVTEDTIIDEVEYAARPRTRYQITPDVVGTLRSATEGVIEAFEAKMWGGKEDSRTPRAAAIEQALEVLDLPEGAEIDRKNVISPVAGRVRDDFLYMSQGKQTAEMRSFTEAVEAWLSAQAANGHQKGENAADLNPSKPSGPSAGKTATDSGAGSLAVS